MDVELKVDKFIVFEITDYLLALPISDVLKVVNTAATVSRRLKRMGLVQIGKHIIKILDLYQQFSFSELPQSPLDESFLIVMRDFQGNLYGIEVDKPPDVMEFPPEIIRSLPASYHDQPAFAMVSNVVVLPYEDAVKTIFLLDVKRIVTTYEATP
jgi:chemotaxis signal transduction protein